MTRLMILLAVVLAVFAVGALASNSAIKTTQRADQKTVDQIIATWKSKPQEVARKMVGKYGLP